MSTSILDNSLSALSFGFFRDATITGSSCMPIISSIFLILATSSPNSCSFLAIVICNSLFFLTNLSFSLSNLYLSSVSSFTLLYRYQIVPPPIINDKIIKIITKIKIFLKNCFKVYCLTPLTSWIVIVNLSFITSFLSSPFQIALYKIVYFSVHNRLNVSSFITCS